MNLFSAARRTFLRFSGVSALFLVACGGRTDSVTSGDAGNLVPRQDGTEDAGGGGAFPSGTIAVGDAFGGVTFYAPGATSGSTPLGKLTWDTGPYQPQYLTFDKSGALYVASFLASGDPVPPARVDVFAPGAAGDAPVAPVRTLAGTQTGLVSARSMVVDAQGYLYVTNASAIQQGGAPSTIAVFAPGQSGDVAPSRVIANAATGAFWLPCGLAMDGNANLYVGDSDPDTVDVFPSTASGTSIPQGTAGTAALLGDTVGLALGNGLLYVANAQPYEIDIFDPKSGDATTPVAVLSGDQTGITGPTDIAIDHAGRILVGDVSGGVRVFAAGASGNVAPIAVLEPGAGMNVAVSP